MTNTPLPEPVPSVPAVPAVPTRGDWRMPLSMGLAIGAAIGVSRGVQTNLEPMFGAAGAFVAGLAAAGAVGAVVSLAVHWLMKPRGAA
jgi:hypothetical protein